MSSGTGAVLELIIVIGRAYGWMGVGMDMDGRDMRIYGIVAEICGFARTVWRGRGLDRAWDLGVYATVCLYTGRVPCGLRTAIVIPIHALKIPDAGRIHAIHGQGPRTGRHTGRIR